MAFYIRKSFSSGPIRINLSKSGIGTSIGFKGFRLGSGPRGSYIHAGRKGIYYRKNLGRRKRAQGSRSKGSGLRRSSPQPAQDSKSKGSGCVILVAIVIAVGIVASIVQWFVENPAIFFALVGCSSLALGIYIYKTYREKRIVSRLKKLYNECFVMNTGSIDDEKIKKLKALKSKVKRDSKLEPELCGVEKDVYHLFLDKILEDKGITPEEKNNLTLLESITTLSDDYRKETKLEIFRSYYLKAIQDRKITAEEVKLLKELILGFGIDKQVIRSEISTVSEIVRMQNLSMPLTPVHETPIKLQRYETPFYSARAKVMSRKKSAKGSEDEYKYSVKREGHFVITDKRVLVVGEGTTTVRMQDILDIDVDLDNSMIIISKENTERPTFIQAHEPLFAGRIIDLLSEGAK